MADATTSDPVWVGRGGTTGRWHEFSRLHPSDDKIVMARARMNADAPYDPVTCHNYPWAAAARIKVLENEVVALASPPSRTRA